MAVCSLCGGGRRIKVKGRDEPVPCPSCVLHLPQGGSGTAPVKIEPVPNAPGTGNVSLRDWFAGMACERDIQAACSWGIDQTPMIYFTREQARYRHADAMLAAREDRPQ